MPDRDELMAAMQARGAALRGLGYRVRFDLEDDEGSILLDGRGNAVELQAVEPDAEADTALRLSAADLLKLIEGRLSPMLAFATGRLRVEGSKGVAMKLAALLDDD